MHVQMNYVKEIFTQHCARRLLLVSLDWTRPKDPRVPLGHGSIIAAVKRDSPQVQLTSLQQHVNSFHLETARQQLRDFINLTEDHRHSCIGMGVHLIKDTREMGFTGTIVLGGPQISYSGKEDQLEKLYPEADAFVRGYGEKVMVQLLNSSPSSKIQVGGLLWKGQDDKVTQSEPMLDDLPSPYLTNSIPLSPFIRWETQRGCPFKCSFCQHREAGQLTRRNLEHTRVLDEIDLFCENKVEDIAVLDPTFNSGPDYKSVLARFIAHGFLGRLSLQCRFEMVDNDFLDLCSKLNVRLEFGLQTIHKNEQEAIARPNNMRRVVKIINELNSRHINYEVSIIFGLPHQTLESFKETVHFCLQNNVPVVKAFPLMLLRGTSMHKNKMTYGLVENSNIIPSVIASPTFTESEWKKMEAISIMLQHSEGKHPNSVNELLLLSSHEHNDKNACNTSALWSPDK